MALNHDNNNSSQLDFKTIMKMERARFGYTQAQVAEKLGISQQRYARYEYGTGLPKIERLITIAKVFDLSLDYICGLTNIRQPIKKSIDTTTADMLN